jgi:hypothetical protein
VRAEKCVTDIVRDCDRVNEHVNEPEIDVDSVLALRDAVAVRPLSDADDDKEDVAVLLRNGKRDNVADEECEASDLDELPVQVIDLDKDLAVRVYEVEVDFEQECDAVTLIPSYEDEDDDVEFEFVAALELDKDRVELMVDDLVAVVMDDVVEPDELRLNERERDHERVEVRVDSLDDVTVPLRLARRIDPVDTDALVRLEILTVEEADLEADNDAEFDALLECVQDMEPVCERDPVAVPRGAEDEEEGVT